MATALTTASRCVSMRAASRQHSLFSPSRSTRHMSTSNWWDDDDIGEGSLGGSKKSVFDVPATESLPPSEETYRKPALFSTKIERRVPQVQDIPRMSMSQALYLAKEAGVFTTREVQTHLLKSPSFSRGGSPLLLEDWWNVMGAGEENPSSAADMGKSSSVTGGATGIKDSLSLSGGSAANSGNTNGEGTSESLNDNTGSCATSSMHTFLSSLSDQGVSYFFDPHTNREYKSSASGIGTRKRATAHVVIQRGTGVVKVNGEEDFFKRWPIYSNRFDVLHAFSATKTAGLFDVYIAVKGGGISGQAGAARLALGRALVDACPDCEKDLEDTLVLVEDTRQKTSKFPGKKGAYARRNWTLRWWYVWVLRVFFLLCRSFQPFSMCKWCLAFDDVVMRGLDRWAQEVPREILCRSRFVASCLPAKDPYLQTLLYRQVLCGGALLEVTTQTPKVELEDDKQLAESFVPPSFVCGVPPSFTQFNQAVALLQSVCPTRMKALQQLETGYQAAVASLRRQKQAAFQSLQRRQSLEMDMAAASVGDSTEEIKTLVNQHVTEIDELGEHWRESIARKISDQLREYMDLVAEVVGEVRDLGSCPANKYLFSSYHHVSSYVRPVVTNCVWDRVAAVVAAVPFRSHPPRVLRVCRMRGDFLKTVFGQQSEEYAVMVLGGLDPEEQCKAVRADVRAAAIVGFARSSNQFEEIKELLEKGPMDCRWPALTEQFALAMENSHGGDSPTDRILITKHSLLGNGIDTVFHVPESSVGDSMDAKLFSIFSLCDSLGVARVFVPGVLVPDLGAPLTENRKAELGSELMHAIQAAAKKLDNRPIKQSGSVGEIIIID